MLLFTTQRNAPLGNPKPLMRLWDAEGYHPRSAAPRSATHRAAPLLNSTLRLSRCFGAGMAGKPFNHATQRSSARRSAPQLNSTTLKGNTNDPNRIDR